MQQPHLLLSNDGAPVHHTHCQVQRQEDAVQLAALPCVMLFLKHVQHLAEAISERAVLLLLNTLPAGKQQMYLRPAAAFAGTQTPVQASAQLRLIWKTSKLIRKR
jgi:hypothetical protein